MIRWYDYIAAYIFADFLLGFFLASLFATTTFGGSLFYGVMVFVVYDLWCDGYCKWRLKKEGENDN